MSKKANWDLAVAKARLALVEISEKREALQKQLEAELWPALADLKSAQEEYEEWQGNLPENMASSATASKLEEVTSIEIPDEPGLDDLGEVEEALSAAEDVELPKGFGRD